MADDIPLGKSVSYTDEYDPGLLFSIPRIEGRADLNLPEELPFYGEDIWNAYELSWLTPSRKPAVATAELRVPARSPNIGESKSLKLYLNSLNGTVFGSQDEAERAIREDVGNTVGAEISVTLTGPSAAKTVFAQLPEGQSIDHHDISETSGDVSPEMLTASADTKRTEETLYTQLFRSLCPVTGQPDWATLFVRYAGYRIDSTGLLAYLLSYRNHHEFHEHCVERIYVDILRRCRPDELSVYGRYTRRGGIDINPYRSSVPSIPENTPAWRQ